MTANRMFQMPPNKLIIQDRREWCDWRAICAPRSAPALLRCGDVRIHLTLQNFERDGAGVEHHVVIFPQREFVAQGFTRLFPQLDNFQLADHIGTSLARKYHVAFNLASFNPIVDGLLAGPVLGMEAGIDHQPPRAPQGIVELPEMTFGVALVPAGFGGQPLGIEPPAFNQCRDVSERSDLAEARKVFILYLQ